MRCRLVLQKLHTGEENLHFITDPVTSVEDCVVVGGGEVQVHTVDVMCSAEVAGILGNREFRCVDNEGVIGRGVLVGLLREAVELIESPYRSDTNHTVPWKARCNAFLLRVKAHLP